MADAKRTDERPENPMAGAWSWSEETLLTCAVVLFACGKAATMREAISMVDDFTWEQMQYFADLELT